MGKLIENIKQLEAILKRNVSIQYPSMQIKGFHGTDAKKLVLKKGHPFFIASEIKNAIWMLESFGRATNENSRVYEVIANPKKVWDFENPAHRQRLIDLAQLTHEEIEELVNGDYLVIEKHIKVLIETDKIDCFTVKEGKNWPKDYAIVDPTTIKLGQIVWHY